MTCLSDLSAVVLPSLGRRSHPNGSPGSGPPGLQILTPRSNVRFAGVEKVPDVREDRSCEGEDASISALQDQAQGDVDRVGLGEYRDPRYHLGRKSDSE